MKTAIQLKDMQGQVLEIGDRVVFSSYKNVGLTVGTVQKLGRVRAEVFAKDGDPGVRAPWLRKGWTESFRTEQLIKV
jgi:hypothetical protein